MSKLSFCESVTASGSSPWCVRALTSVGKKLGGGVDTKSFCGRVRIREGWDLDVKFDPDHPHMCVDCAKNYLKELV